MKPFVNIFACLVHEKPDVVWDLVANLRGLDPTSTVLLYNNSGDNALLEDSCFHADPQVLVYPEPRLHPYGVLHGYMFDCMRWVCQNLKFDTITNVDSDQLLLHPGYSERLTQIVEQHPNLGLLQSSPATSRWPLDILGLPPGRPLLTHPERTALEEAGAWRPFLENYTDGTYRFPQWTFWPGAMFTRQAAQAVLSLLDGNLYLRALIGRSRMFATEEVILPTLVELLGYDLVRTPFDETCLRFKTQYILDALKESFEAPDRFWMHPVPRESDDPLRASIRSHYRQYQHPAQGTATAAPASPRSQGAIPKIVHHTWIGNDPTPEGLLEMREGWRRLHPDWEMRLWTKDNLPPMQNRALYDSRANTAHRADILRYELLRAFGGVYVDFDFECQKPLDGLIVGCEGFAGRHRPVQVDICDQYVEIALLGSVPEHPLFAQIVDALPAWFAAHEQSVIPVRTGPQFFQAQYEAWRAAGGAYGGRRAAFTLFPPELFYPYTWKERERGYEAFPEAYAVHRWWSTWLAQPNS